MQQASVSANKQALINSTLFDKSKSATTHRLPLFLNFAIS